MTNSRKYSVFRSQRINANKSVAFFYNYHTYLARLLVCLPLLTSCSIPVRDNSGTLHYVVIGFGVVSVPAIQQSVAVQAVKSQILGIGISNQPGVSLSFGYASNTVTKIPDGAEDVRVELSDRPGGPVTVDVAASKLEPE